MFGRNRRKPTSRSDHDKKSLHFAAGSEKPHNYRKQLQHIFIGFLLIAFAIITVFGVAIFSMLSVEYKKNILLTKVVIDGKIDPFLLASINNSADNNETNLVMVENELQLVPSSLVLGDTEASRLSLIQASLQTGILIDEIWQVDSFDLQSDNGQQFLFEAWKENNAFSFSKEWLEMYITLLRTKVTQQNISDKAELAAFDITPAGSKIARQCSLAVVNTTSKSGVANFLTSYLEKKGVVVVRVTDNDAQLDSSRVVIAEESAACAEVVSVLKYLQPENASVSVNQEVANDYRASAVFFLGKDISELQKEW